MHEPLYLTHRAKPSGRDLCWTVFDVRDPHASTLGLPGGSGPPRGTGEGESPQADAMTPSSKWMTYGSTSCLAPDARTIECPWSGTERSVVRAPRGPRVREARGVQSARIRAWVYKKKMPRRRPFAMSCPSRSSSPARRFPYLGRSLPPAPRKPRRMCPKVGGWAIPRCSGPRPRKAGRTSSAGTRSTVGYGLRRPVARWPLRSGSNPQAWKSANLGSAGLM